MKLFWGDIHNHCSISYGKGTLRRALANAKEQLDFCAVTGHAFWPDMPMDLARFDDIIHMHLAGFSKLKYFWNEYLEQINGANHDGKFVTFPSYEWHSMKYGDHNCYVNSDHLSLLNAASPAELYQNLANAGCKPILLPHHIGYKRGYRGLNWDFFNEKNSPLVEIYSNHGASEADDAPYEYHHSMGPRNGDSMARHGLLLGHKFGFYASTDSHDGYPGHYGHGRVGVLAEDLTRNSIWEALLSRRTIASTGANINILWELGGVGIGQTTPHKSTFPCTLTVKGTALIDKVELIEGGGEQWKLHRFNVPASSNEVLSGCYQVRIETGWGRKENRSFWDVQAQVQNGELISVTPYFRYSGYNNSEVEPSEKILFTDSKNVSWQASAIPNPAGTMGGTHFNAGGTQSVILEVEARQDSRIKVLFEGGKLDCSLQELRNGSIAYPVGGFGSAAIKVHRAIHESEYTFHSSHAFKSALIKPEFAYVRVTQNDGQIAWTSPIWIDW